MRALHALRPSLLFAAAVVSMGTVARADYSLLRYEFQGQPGNQTSVAPIAGSAYAGLAGLNFTESGVTPSTGANSINASGWNNVAANPANATSYYQFGLNVGAGLAATVSQITLSTRSSGTGPGTLDLLASIDGGAFATVAKITQNNTNYNDQFLAIAPVTATQSLIFRIVVDPNSVQASGSGAIGSGGTFRVGDYNPAGTPTPFTITGTVAPRTGGGGGTTAVPEPASASLLGLGLLGGLAVARRRLAR